MRIGDNQIRLGSYVLTDLGEGFVVGRACIDSASENKMLSVRLFDGSLAHSFPTQAELPMFRTIELIDAAPLHNPNLPKGLRPFVSDQLPNLSKVLEELPG